MFQKGPTTGPDAELTAGELEWEETQAFFSAEELKTAGYIHVSVFNTSVGSRFAQALPGGPAPRAEISLDASVKAVKAVRRFSQCISLWHCHLWRAVASSNMFSFFVPSLT